MFNTKDKKIKMIIHHWINDHQYPKTWWNIGQMSQAVGHQTKFSPQMCFVCLQCSFNILIWLPIFIYLGISHENPDFFLECPFPFKNLKTGKAGEPAFSPGNSSLLLGCSCWPLPMEQPLYFSMVPTTSCDLVSSLFHLL